MILPLREHTIVLKAAEEMACADYNAFRNLPHERGHLPMAPWPPNSSYAAIRVEAKTSLLCDLGLPATRDWWVRWGVDTWRERTKFEYFDANMPYKWHTLRDNVEGLHAQILKEIAAAMPL